MSTGNMVEFHHLLTLSGGRLQAYNVVALVAVSCHNAPHGEEEGT
jgi:hypothetical protein